MKNKRVKQMLVDVALQGRKAFWYGDESEIFLAKSLEQIEDEFGEAEDFPDEYGNVVATHWRYFWLPQIGEINYKEGIKGKPHTRNGEETGWEILPLICAVYGGANDVVQISTGYN